MSQLYNPYEILEKYINNAFDNSQWTNQNIQFFLLNKLSTQNKQTKLLQILKNILWDYFESSFLHIKDFSSKIQKKHNLRIEEQPSSEVHKILLKEHNYQDIWTREINHRLQQSAFSGKKILLIENIERMTIWAINSFLKTCEEPLPGRVILATTDNKSKLLDTVISRAITINFGDESYNNISKLDFSNAVFSWDENFKTTVSILSLWNQDFVNKIIEIIKSNPDLKPNIARLPNLILQKKNYHKTAELLKEFHKYWLLTNIIDGLIFYFSEQNKFEIADQRLKVKKLSNSNVNIDNLIFYGVIL